MSRHRARARRNLRLAQISALGLIVLAGLLAAMPAPRVVTPAPPMPPQTPTTPDAAGSSLELDLSAVAQVLQTRVDKKPLPAGTAPVEDPVEADEETDVAADTPQFVEDGPPHFNYIGMASSPRRNYAFIADHEGKTRTIAQGDYFDDHGEYLVLGISSERIILADCEDTRHEYFIAERPENPNLDAVVDLVSGAVPTTAPKPDPAASTPPQFPPIQAPANMTDPAERERFQQEMEDRRNRAVKNYQPTSQPPARPLPGPPARPGTPATKNPANNSNVK